MLRRVLFLLLLACGTGLTIARAAGPYRTVVIGERELRAAALLLPPEERKEPQRLVAAALALTLGPFGAHRLYLGTDVKVPILYGVTFGGFGVLVVIDLVHVLLTRDLGPYENNRQVFMWARPRGERPTPP